MSDRFYVTEHCSFFAECVILIAGKQLHDLGLRVASYEADDVVTVNIQGALPGNFEAVCLAKWAQLGELGWRQHQGSNLIYQWEATEPSSQILMIPGLGTALDLIAEYPDPSPACVPSPSPAPGATVLGLEVDHRAPYQIARQLVSDDWTWESPLSDESWPTLAYIGGEFFRWDGRRYLVTSDAAMRSDLYARMDSATRIEDGKPFNPDNVKITKILDGMRALVHVEGQFRANYWLDEDDAESSDLISLENGLLDPVSRTLRPHTPRFFTRNTIPVCYDERHNGAPQALLEFLNSCWPHDADSHRLLQQWFGAALVGGGALHKICLLIGPPRSGKGTIMRVLTALLGRENVAGPTLGDFATQFGLAPLIGKRSAIVGDARFAGRPDQMAQAVSRLLSISGGDMLTIDRKHREPWVGRLDLQLFICTNELPRLPDSSGALASRFSVLQMTRSHLGQEDKGLEERLLGELQSILVWALDGLADLIKSGHFVQPEASLSVVADLGSLGSPVFDFVQQCCELVDGHAVRCELLYQQWAAFRKAQGQEHAGTLQTFARDLRAAFPAVTTHQIRSGPDRGKRAFLGIKLGQSAS